MKIDRKEDRNEKKRKITDRQTWKGKTGESKVDSQVNRNADKREEGQVNDTGEEDKQESKR